MNGAYQDPSTVFMVVYIPKIIAWTRQSLSNAHALNNMGWREPYYTVAAGYIVTKLNILGNNSFSIVIKSHTHQHQSNWGVVTWVNWNGRRVYISYMHKNDSGQYILYQVTGHLPLTPIVACVCVRESEYRLIAILSASNSHPKSPTHTHTHTMETKTTEKKWKMPRLEL